MQILGIDIGGTGIKGAIVETDTGELLSERQRLLTPQPATPAAIAATLKELVDTLGFKGPVSCGFPSRIEKGIVRTAANIDKSWIDIPVEQLFSETLGRQVYVANDADVAGLCELKLGAAKGMMGPVLFLTVGTGIGSALFIDGHMYPGTELGHLKFKGDVAEHYCSGAVKEKEDLKWKQWGKRFNEYLRHVDFLLKPDVFVLGGGVSKKFEKYKDEIDPAIKIVPAQHLNLAGIIGAALYGKMRIDGADLH